MRDELNNIVPKSADLTQGSLVVEAVESRDWACRGYSSEVAAMLISFEPREDIIAAVSHDKHHVNGLCGIRN